MRVHPPQVDRASRRAVTTGRDAPPARGTGSGPDGGLRLVLGVAREAGGDPEAAQRVMAEHIGEAAARLASHTEDEAEPAVGA